MRNFMKATLALCLVFGSLALHAQDETDEITADEAEAIIHECINDDANACHKYAYYAAEKLKNLATYRLALKRACRLKHLESCEQIEKDDKEGDQIRKKCDGGDVDSCALYSMGRAQMYEDLIGAIHYANKACKLGHKKSCDQIKAEQDKVKDGIGENHGQ